MKLLLLTTVALMVAPINSVGVHNKHLGRNTKIGAKSPNVYSIDKSQSYVIPSGKVKKSMKPKKSLKGNKPMKTQTGTKPMKAQKPKKSQKGKKSLKTKKFLQGRKLRKLNDISNCLEWKCEQWCDMYTPEMDSEYIKYGCIDDGDYCDCE